MAPKETEDTEVLRRQRAKPSKEDRKKSAELRLVGIGTSLHVLDHHSNNHNF